ncbi:heat shock protein 90 [Tribonema minus]|uniref:Heat shock protein 90 n=1 Tax=Tribonema minus TaxID=303371 RepID=A0A835ZF40_9STRA|nr:heat shock protein 90 [Tribonema minus]
MSTAEAEAEPATAQEETFEFQAEVTRVMDIIINSLYSNRDVFLRELVSNAADACDKKRFLSITEGDGGDATEFRIRVKADKDARTLTIEDSGIGMTKDELINNLGRIAQSGTAKFMEALGKGGQSEDINLIGQFGVGFYSGFLVADRMTVVTRSWKDGADAKQYRWESSAGSSYTICEDDSEPIEGSGTRLVLHLKEDCEQYLDDFKVKELCNRYSEFVTFPIQVWAEKTKYEQVPDPDKEAKEGEEPPMKTVSKTAFEWETMNKMKPIWMRNPAEVNDDEYTEFYKSTFRAWDEPLAHTHFSLEGQVEFKALLYIPGVLPYELSRNMFDDTSRAMRLYVKRVFINDKFEELLPRWLMFLRGLVDSADLPLNVGREILQHSKMLTVINKRLVRKAIAMFEGLAEDEEKYKPFWTSFGKYLKVGIVEDEDNKDTLAKLARFTSTHGDSKDAVSLASYVERMKEGQKGIYYICADSRSAALMSPALEKARKLDYEVLFMTEPLDELCAQAIERFDGKELIDLSKENADLGDAEEEKREKAIKSEETEEFREWLKKAVDSKVQKVEVSTRLVDSPATLVQSAYGMSPTMQRYMKAQAVAMGEEGGMFGGGLNQAVLEINLTHPIIKRLETRFRESPDTADTKALALLIYDVAALTGGYSIENAASFAARVTALMMRDAELSSDAAGSSSDDSSSSSGDDGESVEAEIVA